MENTMTKEEFNKIIQENNLIEIAKQLIDSLNLKPNIFYPDSQEVDPAMALADAYYSAYIISNALKNKYYKLLAEDRITE